MIFEIHSEYKKHLYDIASKVLNLKHYELLEDHSLDEKYIRVEVKPYQFLHFAKDIGYDMTIVTEKSTKSLWYFWVE